MGSAAGNLLKPLGWNRSETARTIADPLNLFHQQAAPTVPAAPPPAPTLQNTSQQADQQNMELQRRMAASMSKVNPTGAAGLAFGSAGRSGFGG